MTRITRLAALLLVAAAPASALADRPSACGADPRATGMPERIQNMRSQMNRIEYTADPEERRRLMDLHMKVMHEGIRELDRRQASDGCRMEMMHAMMEQMMRHQLAVQEDATP